MRWGDRVLQTVTWQTAYRADNQRPPQPHARTLHSLRTSASASASALPPRLPVGSTRLLLYSFHLSFLFVSEATTSSTSCGIGCIRQQGPLAHSRFTSTSHATPPSTRLCARRTVQVVRCWNFSPCRDRKARGHKHNDTPFRPRIYIFNPIYSSRHRLTSGRD